MGLFMEASLHIVPSHLPAVSTSKVKEGGPSSKGLGSKPPLLVALPTSLGQATFLSSWRMATAPLWAPHCLLLFPLLPPLCHNCSQGNFF